MAVWIGKIDRIRLVVVDNQLASDGAAAMIRQAHIGEAIHKLCEPAGIDTEGNEMKPGCRFRSLRLTFEQRKFRAAAVARNHQRSARIVGPLLIPRNNPQPEHLFVPSRRFLPVRHKEFDVIDLKHLEGSHVAIITLAASFG
jgi:hypothetical protein